jgi:hypothetical protein
MEERESLTQGKSGTADTINQSSDRVRLVMTQDEDGRQWMMTAMKRVMNQVTEVKEWMREREREISCGRERAQEREERRGRDTRLEGRDNKGRELWESAFVLVGWNEA